jgi:hypothetical protein
VPAKFRACTNATCVPSADQVGTQFGILSASDE